MKEPIYESKISDARWIAYDLPGNVGWIVYWIFLVRLLLQGVTAFSVLAILPGVLMLVGIGELISERIQKLDRVLTRGRLFRGFGALTVGGILGALLSALGLLCFRAGANGVWMLCGALLCALFAWLILREYHRKTP